MKRKRLVTYSLLTVVVAIWGKVVWDIVSAYSQDAPEVTAWTPMEELAADTLQELAYVPVGDYRDPFLGKTARPRSQNQSAQAGTLARTKPKEKPKPTVIRVWPNIQYRGSMRNRATGEALAILNINGQEVLLSEGEGWERFTIQSIHPDSVLMAWDGETKSIAK